MTNHALPLVSIITPSFNQVNFIRETIESVKNQNYPNIEHIVIDGGSTDGTLSILQEYRQLLGERFHFVSEPDRGQSHAINKGLAMAKGEIIGWVNSDDTYASGAVRKAVEALQHYPQWGIVCGIAHIVNEHGQTQSVVNLPFPDHQKLFHTCCIAQPSAFLRKSVFKQAGGADESLRFCMDYDLWIRIAKHHHIGFISEHLANARIHSTCKTATLWNTVGVPEVLKTVAKHYGRISSSWMAQARRIGIPWLIQQCKKLSLFGPTSKVTEMNRYPDLWVPPQFTVTIEAEPAGIHSLIVKGSVPLPFASPSGPKNLFQSTVLVNGKSIGTFQTTVPNFTWEIPLNLNSQRNFVTIFSAHSMIQHHPGVTRGAVSFMAQDVLPLSTEEKRFYHLLQGQDPHTMT